MTVSESAFRKTFSAAIQVMLKPSVNDPQGLSIRGALLSLGFDDFAHVEEEDFYDEEEWEQERGFWNRPKSSVSGRSAVTGY